jgi:hypothetical protein
MALIRQRLDEVRAGLLTLNRAGDAEFFTKQAGITPYALENSPLIALFTAAETDAGCAHEPAAAGDHPGRCRFG